MSPNARTWCTRTCDSWSVPERIRGSSGTQISRSFGEDLLPQDVCVTAVLRELAKHVQIDPPQRQRSPTVSRDQIIKRQRRCRATGLLPRQAVRCTDRLDRVRSSSKDSVGPATIPSSCRDCPVTASPNHTLSTKAECFTRPSKVVEEGTVRRLTCSSVRPSKQLLSAVRCSSRNTSTCSRSGRLNTLGSSAHSGLTAPSLYAPSVGEDGLWVVVVHGDHVGCSGLVGADLRARRQPLVVHVRLRSGFRPRCSTADA